MAEVDRWVHLGYVREASPDEAQDWPFLSSGFVVDGPKSRPAIDYSWFCKSIADRPFKMETVKNLSPQLKGANYLWKDDIQDTYYHLKFRRSDRQYLRFHVEGRFFELIAAKGSLRCLP